jgi:protein-tyrosine phosphatase
MIPLVDMHVHLLAGLDDGPATEADALEMCRQAYADGIRAAAATAHQNERWGGVTPGRIRRACVRLRELLREAAVDLTVFPCAEVMVAPQTEAAWREGRLLSVADRGEYLLLELPPGLFLDLRETAAALARAGVRPILAHPERHPEFLDEPGALEGLVRAGCLVQVSSGSVTAPRSRRDGRALKDWFRRGLVHLLGSDGHSPQRRQPRMADAYRQIASWAGSCVADRVCSTNALAVCHGLPLRVPGPAPRPRRWLRWLW